MKKFSFFTIIYLILWTVVILLYKFNIISIPNSIFNNISTQLLILGAFIFFIGFIINKFLVSFNEKKLDKWIVIYNLILIMAIIMTIINKINSNWIIDIITNTLYIGIGGCLLFGICSIKELLKID